MLRIACLPPCRPLSLLLDAVTGPAFMHDIFLELPCVDLRFRDISRAMGLVIVRARNNHCLLIRAPAGKLRDLYIAA